ncbi:unnamed protein product [Sphagnum tenellum]
MTSTFLLRVTTREGKAIPEAQEERERPATPRGGGASEQQRQMHKQRQPAHQPSPAREPCTLAKPRCHDDVSSCPGQVPIFLAQWHITRGRE